MQKKKSEISFHSGVIVSFLFFADGMNVFLKCGLLTKERHYPRTYLDNLRLLPTFRCQKNRFFFLFDKIQVSHFI